MPFLLMYWKHLLAVCIVTFALAYTYRMGGTRAKLECAQAQLAAQALADKAMAQAQQESAEANEALRRKLAKPRPGQTIREVVSEYPSDCRVDPVVADRVRQAVVEANKRAAAK